MRLGVFGGGRERKVKELRAKATHLGRSIEECQRALADCAPDDDDVGGYRAARRLRASLLESELDAHRAEFDTLAAQIIKLETAMRSQPRERRITSSPTSSTGSPKSARLFQRRGLRLGLIAATVVAALILLVAVTPVEGALGLIPTLIAHEDVVVVVDPATLSGIIGPKAYASLPTAPEVASVRQTAMPESSVAVEAAAPDTPGGDADWASKPDEDQDP